MPEPMRQHPLDPRAPGSPSPNTAQRSVRPLDDDPLEELARILGETGGYPARPETTVEVGRRATPQRAMPQQLSALEAQLFDELRSSVAPEDRVRGDFVREIPPVIPQRPVNDHEIASLRIDDAAEVARMTARAQTAAVAPQAETGRQETPYADYYAYDDGVAAGSYDPAFAPAPPVAPPTQAVHGGGHAQLRSNFAEFGTDDIAAAAQESSPYAAAEPLIRPHSSAEVRAAARLPKQRSRSVLSTVLATVGILVVGGGAYAGWKFYGSDLVSSGPVSIHADGKPLKVRGKEQDKGDAQPTLQADAANGASKIYSAQEDPVEQVRGVSPEGKEVRVINPGAQRSNSDQPHTVKTVIVRPDGSIVTDGGAPVRSVAPVRITPEPVQPQAAVPSVPPPATNSGHVSPPTSIDDLTAQAAGGGNRAAAQSAPPVPVVKTVPVVVTPSASQQAAAPKVAPPAPPVAPPKVTASTPAPTPPKPVVAPQATTSGTPMALGPTSPRMASAAPAATAPSAAPTAPTASGDWMVQISASKSDADARRSGADAQKRYSSLAGRSIDVQTANLGEKGTFYRTRFAAGSKEQAAALCQQITSQGGQCMVVRR